MILTKRDASVVRDIALSHVLSRDQLMALGWFSSITRANTRLRVLRELGFVKKLETPFFTQSLYMAGVNAPEITGQRIAQIIKGRAESPRFIQHALCLTNIRIALLSKGAHEWRFEQQLRHSFSHNGKRLEVRPDGLAITSKGMLVVEADLGNASIPKLAEKLKAFDSFQASGYCHQFWGCQDFTLLIVTTGKLRAKHIEEHIPVGLAERCIVDTFSDLGAELVQGWS